MRMISPGVSFPPGRRIGGIPGRIMGMTFPVLFDIMIGKERNRVISWQKKSEKNLTDCIIPFWKLLQDEEFGGYYGLMDYDLNVDKQAAIFRRERFEPGRFGKLSGSLLQGLEKGKIYFE